MNAYTIVDEFDVENKKMKKFGHVTVLDRAPSIEDMSDKMIIDGVAYTFNFVHDVPTSFTIPNFKGTLLGKTVRFSEEIFWSKQSPYLHILDKS